MTIIESFISRNYDTGGSCKPQYIIIHETANTAVGANARAHFSYWNRDASARASAHFVVDDTEILNLVPQNRPAWHIGDGGAANPIHNRNALGIEICVNADGNYDRAVKNALLLTRYLMKQWQIPTASVLRHYDVSGKACPAVMLREPERWTAFKAALRADPLIFCGDTPQTIEAILRNDTTYAPLRALCERLGHSVLWDAEGSAVTIC